MPSISADARSSDDVTACKGPAADLWSLGIVMYEVLYGCGPFDGDEDEDDEAGTGGGGGMSHARRSIQNDAICEKIKAHALHFSFPELVNASGGKKISADVKDLIAKLLCDEPSRIGIEEIKAHPFFNGVDWQHIHELKAPFTPELSSAMDTSLCECEGNDMTASGMHAAVSACASTAASRLHSGNLKHAVNLPFTGFQYVCPRIDQEISVAVDSPKQLRGKARRRLSIDARSRKSPLRVLAVTDMPASAAVGGGAAAAAVAPAANEASVPAAIATAMSGETAATAAGVGPLSSGEPSPPPLPDSSPPSTPVAAPPPPPPPLTSTRSALQSVISSPSLASSPAVSSVASCFERRAEAAGTPLPARGNLKFAAAKPSFVSKSGNGGCGTLGNPVAEWRMNRSRNVAAATEAAAAKSAAAAAAPAPELLKPRSRNARLSHVEATEAAVTAEAEAAPTGGAARRRQLPQAPADVDEGTHTVTAAADVAKAAAATTSNLKKAGAKSKAKKGVKFADTAVLLDAVTLGDLDTVTALLLAGTDGGARVDVNWKSPTGLTALCRASLAGQMEVARHLLKQPGCAVNSQCLDGCTALHLAILEEHTEMVVLLLQHGAESVMNFDGETPLDWTDESPVLCDIITTHFATATATATATANTDC